MLYEVKYIKDYADSIQKLLDQKDVEIAKLKNNDFGKFKSLKSNGTIWSEYLGVAPRSTGNYWGIERRPYSTPEEAQSALDATYAKALELDTVNAEISKHNSILRDKLLLLIESCGLAKTQIQRKKRSSYKTETVDADWYSALKYIGPKCDAYHTSDSKRHYEDCKKKIDEWRKSIEQEKLEAKKAESARKSEREKSVNLGYLITKYNLDKDIGEFEILGFILEQCKYLRLAHYMEKNRGDWNDGEYYASVGLDGFTCENTEDKKIEEEISGLISNWDGDGRCFRDCKYNYSVLFAMVDSELLKDYDKAKQLIGE